MAELPICGASTPKTALKRFGSMGFLWFCYDVCRFAQLSAFVFVFRGVTSITIWLYRSKVVLAYEGADYEELCRGFVVPDTWPKKPKKRRARSRSSWPDLKSSFMRPSRVFEVPKLTASGRRAFLRVEGSCVTRYDLGVCGSARFRGVTHVFPCLDDFGR